SVLVLRNGVELAAPERDRTTVRRSLGVDGDAVLIAYVARLAAHKGQRLLLEALAAGGSGTSNFSAVLVGEGPDRPVLDAMIQRLGLQDRVKLVGVVSDVETYLNAADVGCLLSEREGMSN